MKLRYVGETFGAASLTNGVVYDCLGIDREDEQGLEFGILLRIVDDSEEEYLYSPTKPGPLDGSSPGGRWEIIEDDDKGTLKKLLG